MADFGYKKFVFVRIDEKHKDKLKNNKSLEFIWKPFYQVDSGKNEIFTHITYDYYCPFGPLNDFWQEKELFFTPEELAQKAQEVYDMLKQWSTGFRTNNVMMLYGCDFTFNNASHVNYKNIEKIMKYFVESEKFPDMKLVYSTPSKYFKAISEAYNEWPTYKNQDFFPYAAQNFDVWSGFYTSRPFLKGTIRDGGNYLSSTSKLLTELIFEFKKKGIMQSTLVKKYLIIYDI